MVRKKKSRRRRGLGMHTTSKEVLRHLIERVGSLGRRSEDIDLVVRFDRLTDK